MKLLLHSNAPWSSTGYGQQTSIFAPLLAKKYELAISAFYGLEGAPISWKGIPVLPGEGPTFGNETIEGYADNWFEGNRRGGLILTLMDAWVLNPTIWRQFNLASWAPVDHDPAPPMVRRFFAQSGAVPIAMSKFGEEMLADFDPLYCPHAVETEIYKPHPKRESRDLAKLPQDAFVVGVVAANKGFPPRKCFPEIFQAFAAFRERHDDALLYLHTEVNGRTDGIRLSGLVESLGLQDSVCYCNQHRYLFDPLPRQVMAKVYSAMDVLLNPSMGEGFGIPIIEAQACGVPVIVTDFSAMPEVCGAGWKVEYTKEWSPQGSWHARPKVEDIVESLEACYALAKGPRKQLSDKARAHSLRYDVQRVFDGYMLPALQEVQERFEAEKPFVPEKVAA